MTASDAADASAPVIGPVAVTLAAGGNYTATANLDADGAPTANFYTNDTSAVDAGQSRLTVRHTAAAPAVDVLAGDAVVVENLSNPDEATLTTDAGTIAASVAATGTTDPVIGPADLTLAEGTATIVYAWGSLEDGNLALATQVIEGLHSDPAAVPGARAGPAQDNTVALEGFTARGSATVLAAGDGARTLEITVTNEQAQGYQEVWLIAPDLEQMYSLGVIGGGTSSLVIPDDVDLAAFPIVDVSDEPLDGDPVHSGVSVLRGTLDAAAG
ncbi:hypothetical protein IWX62_000628 [Arthrobacter sp. CAN_A1]